MVMVIDGQLSNKRMSVVLINSSISKIWLVSLIMIISLDHSYKDSGKTYFLFDLRLDLNFYVTLFIQLMKFKLYTMFSTQFRKNVIHNSIPALENLDSICGLRRRIGNIISNIPYALIINITSLIFATQISIFYSKIKVQISN